METEIIHTYERVTVDNTTTYYKCDFCGCFCRSELNMFLHENQCIRNPIYLKMLKDNRAIGTLLQHKYTIKGADGKEKNEEQFGMIIEMDLKDRMNPFTILYHDTNGTWGIEKTGNVMLDGMDILDKADFYKSLENPNSNIFSRKWNLVEYKWDEQPIDDDRYLELKKFAGTYLNEDKVPKAVSPYPLIAHYDIHDERRLPALIQVKDSARSYPYKERNEVWNKSGYFTIYGWGNNRYLKGHGICFGHNDDPLKIHMRYLRDEEFTHDPDFPDLVCNLSIIQKGGYSPFHCGFDGEGPCYVQRLYYKKVKEPTPTRTGKKKGKPYMKTVYKRVRVNRKDKTYTVMPEPKER